jgi:hypothetical protein
MITIDRRRRAAPCPREEGRYKWKGVEYELTTPSMLLKIINSVDDSKDGHYYPLGRFLAEDDGIWVAVDNECGCAWTEEFYNKTVALNWLCTSMYGDTERAHEVDRATTARNKTIRAKEEELRRRPS